MNLEYHADLFTYPRLCKFMGNLLPFWILRWLNQFVCGHRNMRALVSSVSSPALTVGNENKFLNVMTNMDKRDLQFCRTHLVCVEYNNSFIFVWIKKNRLQTFKTFFLLIFTWIESSSGSSLHLRAGWKAGILVIMVKMWLQLTQVGLNWDSQIEAQVSTQSVMGMNFFWCHNIAKKVKSSDFFNWSEMIPNLYIVIPRQGYSSD